jgi:hypothetical protein
MVVRTRLRRDWRDALAEHAGKPCRVCGRYTGVQLAHILGRKYDQGGYVHPASVVPLCEPHHRMYDSYTYNLNPHLSDEERSWVVQRVGYGNAMRRIVGRAFLEGDA